jgi:hypothetical protein
MWNNWFNTAEMSFTRHHNVCGPGYVLMTNWITEAWQSLTQEYLCESFKYCGITTSQVDDYHHSLKLLLRTAEMLPNTTVEEQNEEDEHDIFLPDLDLEVPIDEREFEDSDEEDEDDEDENEEEEDCEPDDDDDENDGENNENQLIQHLTTSQQHQNPPPSLHIRSPIGSPTDNASGHANSIASTSTANISTNERAPLIQLKPAATEKSIRKARSELPLSLLASRASTIQQLVLPIPPPPPPPAPTKKQLKEAAALEKKIEKAAQKAADKEEADRLKEQKAAQKAADKEAAYQQKEQKVAEKAAAKEAKRLKEQTAASTSIQSAQRETRRSNLTSSSIRSPSVKRRSVERSSKRSNNKQDKSFNNFTDDDDERNDE